MKYKLLFFSLLVSNFCFGQYDVDKGAKIIGGKIGYNRTNTNNFDYTSLNTSHEISPFIAYFPQDRLAIGLHIIFSGTTEKRTNLVNAVPNNWNETQQQMVGLSPFIRYYIPIGPKLYFYGQFNAYNGFGTSETNFSNPSFGNSGKLDIRQFGIAVIPGFSFAATNRLKIGVSINMLNYNRYKFYLGDTLIQKYDNANFGFGDISPTVGISVNF